MLKKTIQVLMMGALMMALPFLFTSCEDILGHWEKPTPVPEDVRVLGAALQEGALISYTFSDGTNTYTVTFKKVGDTYVRQTPSATRGTIGWSTTYKAKLESRTNTTNFKMTLDLTIYCDEEGKTPALVASTDVESAATQITRYNSSYSLDWMNINGKSIPRLDEELNLVNNGGILFVFDHLDYTFEKRIGCLSGTTWGTSISSFTSRNADNFYLYLNDNDDNVYANVPVTHPTRGLMAFKCQVFYSNGGDPVKQNDDTTQNETTEENVYHLRPLDEGELIHPF